jgi:hypothetical protein
MAGGGVNLVLIVAAYSAISLPFNNEAAISVFATSTPLGNNGRMRLHPIAFYGDYQP